MGCVGSSIPVAFFKLVATITHIELYAIQRQFNHDHVKSYKDFQQLKEEKARRKSKKKS
jgi:hypothetical protein